MDKANISELLKFILESIALIKERFLEIENSDSFMENNERKKELLKRVAKASGKDSIGDGTVDDWI